MGYEKMQAEKAEREAEAKRLSLLKKEQQAREEKERIEKANEAMRLKQEEENAIRKQQEKKQTKKEKQKAKKNAQQYPYYGEEPQQTDFAMIDVSELPVLRVEQREDGGAASNEEKQQWATTSFYEQPPMVDDEEPTDNWKDSEICWTYAQKGWCPWGAKCQWAHPPMLQQQAELVCFDPAPIATDSSSTPGQVVFFNIDPENDSSSLITPRMILSENAVPPQLEVIAEDNAADQEEATPEKKKKKKSSSKTGEEKKEKKEKSSKKKKIEEQMAEPTATEE